MAAGLGFKTFTTGEVLTAADVNGYLMQGVLVFATAAARNAAITSPQEGQFAFTKDTNGLWYYDGAAWVASGATGDIEGVTAGVGISGGGTSGTVTVTNSMATAITTNGDIIYGTGSGTFSRLGIGSSAQVLTVASGVPSWATPAASGGDFVLITAQTFTSSSGVNVNSVFNGTYNNYKVIINVTAVSTDNQYDLRMRASGSDNTSSNYQYAGINLYSDLDTVYVQRSNSGTAFARFGSSASADNGATNMVLEFQNPYASIRTGLQYGVTGSDGSRAIWDTVGGIFDGTNSFDGFSILVDTGTITGKVYVYGYKV